MAKNSQNLSKRESRAFIQRLKVFSHYILNSIYDKLPCNALISLCHELISQSEYLLFENNADGSAHDDPNSSVNALR